MAMRLGPRKVIHRDAPKAILRLDLKDQVPAYALKRIITSIDDVYTSYHWFALAEASKEKEPFGHNYFPDKDFLIIQRLEIGTPNFVEFIGLMEPIIETVKFFIAANGVLEGVKNILEIERLLKERNQKGNENENTSQETIIGKAKRLFCKNKISKKSLESKYRINEYLDREGYYALENFVTGGEILPKNEKSNEDLPKRND